MYFNQQTLRPTTVYTSDSILDLQVEDSTLAVIYPDTIKILEAASGSSAHVLGEFPG